MSKTKIPSLTALLFLAPISLNRMVRVSFAETVRCEQRDEEGEGRDTCREGVFRRRAPLVKRLSAHCRQP